jgi:serine/threonine protein kinase
LTGRKLGQYAVLEKIGQGGMGSVYKAFDTALERTVALKVLLTAPVDDTKQAERFMREARSLARLTHPNLLHIYNVGQEGACHYFAMELLEGETLTAVLRRRQRLPPGELLSYLGQILSALYCVHEQGITHRDIKSGNIMLCGRRAVLMDFGLAKDEAAAGLTSVGSILGTPDYMSPEAAAGNIAGPPTDIYSVGVVLYEALAGKLPFAGRSAMAIMRQHMDTPPPPIQGLLPEIDPRLAKTIHTCLAKDPKARYPHCPALAADLVAVHATPELNLLAEERPGTTARIVPQRPAVADSRSDSTRTPAPVPASALDATVAGSAARASEADIAPTVLGDTVRRAAPAEHAPRRTVPPWAWVAAGFFGVLILGVVLIGLRAARNRAQPAELPSQPALLRRADGSTEEIRWLRFKAGAEDPSDWQHVIERQQADGTWVRTTVRHGELLHNGDTLELLTPAGGAQTKP